jgi:hypothetical protein
VAGIVRQNDLHAPAAQSPRRASLTTYLPPASDAEVAAAWATIGRKWSLADGLPTRTTRALCGPRRAASARVIFTAQADGVRWRPTRTICCMLASCSPSTYWPGGRDLIRSAAFLRR